MNEPINFESLEWLSAILITPRNSTRLYSYPAEDSIGSITLDNTQCLHIAHLSTKQSRNLESCIELAVGMKAMVLANIATEADLVNGMRGVVTGIILDEREPPYLEVVNGVTMLRYPPAAVFFKPDGAMAVRLANLPEGLLPIIPQEAKFQADIGKNRCRTIT
ncbi:hypothetical protein GYMLUDRAFT_57949 [Collybiopsis luxurians FD-317 M1]|uniref:Unplaced genomic scaffold GYMLUscaffold_17, whole genome shotgun sequence n=1 Tax=Collybiopsis luxurians FD-317 M1 TaxID=944289 RepID=A0A0D0CUK8_9AGAR|nr:hypothetical protein GYMLUDRAFT_57949 [Collybiopsis luxurians FD-317 M1]